ncbi:MAG: ATP-dependent Clp protease proteolytic subunit [Patescibacteria group bacterium]
MSTTSVKAWMEKSVIFLNGKITSATAMLIENAIEKISSSGKEPLFFIINCEDGGDFYAVLKIKSLLENYKGEVTTVIFGMAFSGGFLLSQIGSKRFATEKSRLRFHQATFTFAKDLVLNAQALQEFAHRLIRIDGIQLEILAARARPVKAVFELFEKEATINAQEAQKVGLLDGIIKEPVDVEELISFLNTDAK